MTQDSEQRDERWARLAGLAGGLVAVAALTILTFYCTSLYELLPAGLAQTNPVKPNTALCLLLLSLTVVTSSGDLTTSRWLSTLLLLPPLIIALATLGEYASGWDAGIDGLLVAARSWDHPVRMLPSTAVCLGLLSAALLLPRDATAAARSALLMGAVGLALLNLTATAYRAESRYGLAEQASMPAAAAALITLLGLAALALRPDYQPIALLASPGSGGRLARRVVPLALVMPITLGWLRVGGLQLGLYDETFGIAVTVTVTSAVLLLVTYAACLNLGRVEDQRARAMAEAAEREVLFRTAVESMPDCFVLFSAVRNETGRIIDLRYEYLNEAACRNNGTTREESTGRLLLDVLPHHRDNLFEQYCQVIETGEPLLLEAVPYEDEYLGSQRIKAYFDVRASKLGDGLTYIFRDVTDRVQSALDLEEKTRELERSNRELQSFAYIASHDLQEPLRKIRTFGERVETLYAEALGSRGLDHLRRMRAAAARMGDLLDGLLEYSRVSHRPSTMEPVALDHLVPRVLDDLEVAVAASGAVIEVGQLPCVIGNPAQLHGLFQNLLANAIKFRHAERPPRIEVCAGEHFNGQVWVVVRDNGIGFEPQYAERLFEPFQRLHTLDEYAGAGMGLASARRVAERHGGRIEARGELGVGAEFRILLPADPAADEVAPSEPDRPA